MGRPKYIRGEPGRGASRRSVRVPDSLWRSFEQTAVQSGHTASEHLRMMMAKEVGVPVPKPGNGFGRISAGAAIRGYDCRRIPHKHR